MGITLLDKRIIFLLIILLFANSVYAQDIVVPEGELSKDDLILKQAQQQVLATSNVSVQMNQIAVQSKENLELAIGILLQNQNEHQTTLIITLILVTLASQGLWWAVFLYYQTKGMLPMLKVSKPKKPKKKEKPTNLQQVFE